jgi:hypothetical protein
MVEDILTEFEEKEEVLKWHDEVAICVIGVFVLPIIAIITCIRYLFKSKHNK